MQTLSVSPLLAKLMTMMFALLAAAAVQGSVVINSTRLVYPQNGKEITARLESKNQAPVLVQTWLDAGDEHSTPELAGIPFIVTPPIFRMEPGKQQVIRLAYIGETLPLARESLFWLNLLEVPSQPPGTQQSNQLQLAFRSRIKLFLRPPNLPYGVEEAAKKLQWHHVSTEQGQALEVYNPTPYYLTFEQVEVLAAGQRYPRETMASGAENMVAPGGRRRFALPSLKAAPGSAASVEFQTLDDFGIKVSHSAKVTP